MTLLRFALPALCVVAATASAQVRMNLRANMQIDTLAGSWGSLSPDERFWPIESNQFAAGDLDADGDLDLVAAGNDTSGRIWFNDGDGAFLRFLDVGQGHRSVVLFDCDGDGDLDVFFGGGRTTYGGADFSQLYRNAGAGAFTPSPTIPSQYLVHQVEAAVVEAGDLDGDGDLDLVLFTQPGPFNPGGLRAWRNDGTGTFTDQSAASLPTSAPFPWGALGMLADVDSDGDLDIVTDLHATSGEQPYLNDGTGHFTAGSPIAWPVPDKHAAVADFDNDGLLDMARTDAYVLPRLWRNTGSALADVTAQWFEPSALVNRTVGYTHGTCIAFDIDNDGDQDLVTGGSEGRNTTSTTVGVPPRVFVNEAGQRFVEAGRPALPMLEQAYPASLAAGDVDGDGDVDLVCAAKLWKQDAAGRFAEAVSSHAVFSAHTVTLADVDADGDLDAVGLSGWGPQFPGVVGPHHLALNDGTGQFTDVTATHMPASAVSGGGSCAAGDVDGDGDADVVIGSYSTDSSLPGVPLMLLRNSGAGVFSDASAQLPPTLHASGHVALRDFDGDGDLDLVAANDVFRFGYPTPLVLFANNGTGTFTDVTATWLPAGGATNGLWVLDLDGDGDLDIAQSNVDLRNNGSGVFTATPAATRAFVADLDEDGAPDSVSEPTLQLPSGRYVWGDLNVQGRVWLPVDLDQDEDLDLVVVPLHAYGNSDWAMFRIEVIYNLRRDLRVATLPRIGQPYRLHLRAGDSSGPVAALVAFSTATLPQRLQLPGLGRLLLDPALLQVFAFTVVPDPDTTVELSLPIPDDPVFLGVPLSCQALFGPVGNPGAAHLSNAMTYAIGG